MRKIVYPDKCCGARPTQHARGCRPGRPRCKWMRAKSPNRQVCGCKAYRYPHRVGSGLCQAKPDDTPIKERKSTLALDPVYPSKSQINAALTILRISQTELTKAIDNEDLALAKSLIKKAFAKIVSAVHPDHNNGSRKHELDFTEALSAKRIIDKITNVKDLDFRKFAAVANRRDEKIRSFMEMMDEFFLSEEVRQA